MERVAKGGGTALMSPPLLGHLAPLPGSEGEVRRAAEAWPGKGTTLRIRE